MKDGSCLLTLLVVSVGGACVMMTLGILYAAYDESYGVGCSNYNHACKCEAIGGLPTFHKNGEYASCEIREAATKQITNE